MNLEELKTKWDHFAPVYTLMDTATNTFFYQLVHMLKLDSATSIYEVGCGSGRLIPYVMSLKNR
jgi:trans-aconitate methyltransferase